MKFSIYHRRAPQLLEAVTVIHADSLTHAKEIAWMRFQGKNLKIVRWETDRHSLGHDAQRRLRLEAHAEERRERAQRAQWLCAKLEQGGAGQ